MSKVKVSLIGKTKPPDDAYCPGCNRKVCVCKIGKTKPPENSDDTMMLGEEY